MKITANNLKPVNVVKEIRSSITDNKLLINRREEIVLKSCKLFLTKGYDRTTIREIAKNLGMTTGGLYRYISSKEDILRLILDYTELRTYDPDTESIKSIQLPPVESLNNLIESYFTDIEKLKYLYQFLNAYAGAKRRRDRLNPTPWSENTDTTAAKSDNLFI